MFRHGGAKTFVQGETFGSSTYLGECGLQSLFVPQIASPHTPSRQNSLCSTLPVARRVCLRPAYRHGAADGADGAAYGADGATCELLALDSFRVLHMTNTHVPGNL